MFGVRLCGGVAVEAEGRRLPDALLAGRQGRLVLAYLVLERHRSVPREELAELLWGERPPSSWPSALSSVISKLRRLFAEAGLDGAEVLASAFGSYRLHLPADAWVDWESAADAVERAERAVREGDGPTAAAAARDAQEIARRGFLNDDCPWVDAQRERLRDLLVRATRAQAQAHLLAGEFGRAVSAARDAIRLDELQEENYRLLMQALSAAGERGEALRVWERCRIMLVEELGTNPASETEAVYLKILVDTPTAAPEHATPGLPSGVVTFLLTDIVDSSGLWERDPTSMERALVRHDELVAAAVSSHAGVLLKAKLEGDATVSVFPRASAGAMAAVALQESLANEAWPAGSIPEVRMALHTGEAVERNGDYFGPALNRAARLRSLAGGGQILLSQAVAEVVQDHLPPDSTLRSLGERQLRGMARAEHVYELVGRDAAVDAAGSPSPLERPPVPAVLAARGPFVGRDSELDRLAVEWATATAGTARAVLIAGEPGVGKTRLAAEWARQLYDEGALVLYGRCDEELGAPYQPFAEALRVLVPRLGASTLRSVRGVEQLNRLAPELADVLPDLPGPAQADPDTERALLFDALARLLVAVSAEVPLLIVIDDLHWAAKPTLLLLRHLLRAGDGMRLQVVGTYRSTDLGRTHPLAGVLADLHRDGTAERLTLGGLDAEDVSAYLSAAGYDDARLGDALSSVTSGNPFFLIEVLHHLDETGGRWDPNTLPQGVREAVGRRLSRLSEATNEALLVGAVIGSHFDLGLAERVLERDLVDQVDEARRAGLVAEETGARFRFSHALVRQSLLSEVASVRRVRLHQRVAAALEADPSSAAPGAHLAELAHHWFECAFAGGAAKAVDYSQRAAEQAMARLAYEEAADLYAQGLQAADVEGSECGDDDKAELLLARCEALLAAGDPTAAVGVVEALVGVARSSPRLSAWATCFDGQLAVLVHPERLEATVTEVAAAAEQLARLGDAEGEAKAHTVCASCLARLGRVADCEAALDRALTAGRRAGNPRRVNAVLAGAPVAALWGPSPVARASGRCLDVVRVLRITTGSPAVEAVALRCQAVLEALRGRFDAARRMLASARRALESLGHTHGLLENDVFAGMVELLAGDAPAAEALLRPAHRGFVARGVGVDAAQAAALLARALLAQGDDDEALTFTEESERLAGVDLKAAIAWRAARAEVLAGQGRTAEALDAARAAVTLADPTDALIDQGDAHLSLAVVLRAAGQTADADREASRAAELYERKGATARAAAVGEMLALGAPPPTAPTPLPVSPRRVRANAATVTLQRACGTVEAGDIEGHAALLADDFVDVDHVSHLTTDRETWLNTARLLATKEGIQISFEPIASLGERHSLDRTFYRYGGASVAGITTGDVEAVYLQVTSLNSSGYCVRVERFGADDLHLAMARLLELHADDELPTNTHDARYRMAAQYREPRLDWADDAVLVDQRPAGLGELHGREAIARAAATMRGLSADFRFRITDLLAGTETVVLLEVVSEGHDEYGGPVEITVLAVNVTNDDGFVQRQEWYLPDQVEEAFARFDELTGHAGSGAPDAPVSRRRVRPNAATAGMQRAERLLEGGDIDAHAALMAADFVQVDHVSHLTTDRETWLHTARLLAGKERFETGVEPLATLGERHSLELHTHRYDSASIAGNPTGAVEVVFLQVARANAVGLCARAERFDPEQLHLALARLIELHADDELPVERREGRYAIAAAFREERMRWSHDAVLVDRRPASLGVLEGRDAIRTAGTALRTLSPDLRWRVTDVLGFTERVTLTEIMSKGHADEGGPVEIPVVAINEFGVDGLVHRIEWYSPEQLDDALARFDELVGPGPVSYLANDAYRRVRQIIDHQLADDWDAVAAATAQDFLFEDRRRVVGGYRHEGRDAAVAGMRSVREVGVERIDSIPLASRGDTLALFRAIFSGAGAEAEAIFVCGFDARGLWAWMIGFDPGDIDAAFAELDARYGAGEGAPFAPELAFFTANIAAFNDRDWDRFESFLADDFAIVDHERPAIYGDLDRDQYVAVARGFVEASPDVRVRVIAIPRLAHGVVASVWWETGTGESGAAFEVVAVNIAGGHSGRTQRMEWFAVEDLEAALARFDELVAPVAADHLTNDAHRRGTHMWERALAQDWPAVRAGFAEEAVTADRRAIVGTRAEGRDAVVAFMRSVLDIGVKSASLTPIATRGERLVLERELFQGPVGEGAVGEGEALAVRELASDGRAQAVVLFDPGELDAAFAELEARFATGEAAPCASQLAVLTGVVAAVNDRDWEGVRSFFTDDYRYVDMRTTGTGELDREGHLEYLKALVELSPNVRLRVVSVPHLISEAVLFVLDMSGTDTHGGEFEMVGPRVGFIGAGRFTRIERFATLAEAEAGFDELTRSDTDRGLVARNAAVLAYQRAADGLARHDPAAFGAALAEDALYEDRRHGLGGYAVRGRRANEVHAGSLGAVSALTTTVIATRGERLALHLVSYQGEVGDAGPFEVETVELTETGADELIAYQLSFGPDEQDAAFAELDARYLAGEGASFSAARLGTELMRAYNARDWVALEVLLSDDFAAVDHRTAGRGSMDRAAMIAAWRALVEVAPGMTVRVVSILKVTPEGGIGVVRVSGTDPEGGYVELEFLELVLAHGAQATRIEFFSIDNAEAAMARFDELSRPEEETALVSPNAAAFAWRRMSDALLRSDVTAFVACLSHDILYEDRRHTVGGYSLRGRREIEVLVGTTGGVSARESTLVATRGERLALHRRLYRGQVRDAGPFEIENLALTEIDDAGLISCQLTFDSGDIDAAFEELDARYLAGEAASFAAELEFGTLVQAYNERDWDAFASTCGENLVFADHRPIGLGTLDRDRLVAFVRGVIDLAPDLRLRIVAVPRVTHRATLSLVLSQGTAADDARVEIAFLALQVCRDCRVSRLEYFAVEDLAAAIARFDELTSSGSFEGVPANAATRMMDRYYRLLADGDLEAFLDLHADDYVLDDRRPGLRLQVTGSAVRTHAQGMISFLNGRRAETAALAIAGDRLVLAHVTTRGSAGPAGEAEIPYLVVGEADDDGRIRFAAAFDPDDLASATAELTDRYIAGLPGDEAEVLRVFQGILDAWRQHDFSGLRQLLADDLVLVDHRPMGFGTVDADQWIALVADLVERAPDAVFMPVMVHAVTGHGAVIRDRIIGGLPDGGPFELVFETVALVADSKATRFEVFDAGQVDDALRRFEELADTPSSSDR